VLHLRHRIWIEVVREQDIEENILDEKGMK
jgi:hypothetical protein